MKLNRTEKVKKWIKDNSFFIYEIHKCKEGKSDIPWEFRGKLIRKLWDDKIFSYHKRTSKYSEVIFDNILITIEYYHKKSENRGEGILDIKTKDIINETTNINNWS